MTSWLLTHDKNRVGFISKINLSLLFLFQFWYDFYGWILWVVSQQYKGYIKNLKKNWESSFEQKVSCHNNYNCKIRMCCSFRWWLHPPKSVLRSHKKKIPSKWLMDSCFQAQCDNSPDQVTDSWDSDVSFKNIPVMFPFLEKPML